MNHIKPIPIDGFKGWWHSLIAIFVLILLSGCQGSQKKATYTIAFSQCIGSDAWRETMYREMQRELSFHDNVEFIYLDAMGDSQIQIEQLRGLLKRDIDLLIISPNEAEPLTPIVDEFFQNRIPVVVTDRKTSSGLYNAYVGADNFDIGHLAGVYLGQKLKGKGKVVEITGLPGTSASIERQQGFESALQSFPAIEVIGSLNGEWLIDVAQSRVSENPTLVLEADAVFAFNDQMALGAHQAVEIRQIGKDIKIIGVDALTGENNGLDQVSKGIFEASMLYPTGGKEAVRTAVAILNNEPYQRETILRTMAIDSSNVQLMKMQADRVISQQLDIDKQQELLLEQQAIYRDQQTILNILVVSLVLAVIFSGISFYLLKANWEKNKRLEEQNRAITDQQNELIKLNSQLNEATDAKINFFTNISHEFKTPLTLILSPVEDMIADKWVTGDVKDQLQLVRKNSLRLMKLVTQLIDLRRAGYEGMRIQAFPQPIAPFIAQIVHSFKPIIRHKKMNVHFLGDTMPDRVWFDSNLMEKVIYNLLSNALKFTSDKGEISIRVGKDMDKQEMVVQIADSGRGIKSNHIGHIFDPFYRGECSSEGSGLGLGLVKEIIELHHGQIEVHSKENEGTRFTIRIPLGDAHLSDDEKADDTQAIDSLIHIDRHMIDFDQSVSAQVDKESEIRKQHSVFVIDDNEDILYFLSQKLQDVYTIYRATRVDQAMDIIFTKLPDVIISDLVMPEKSGIDLLRLVKNDPRTSHIPIVLLTAHQNATQKTEGIEALADMYITKPFNMEHLKAVIKSLITNRKRLQQKYISQPEEFLQVWSGEVSESDRRFLNDLSALVELNLGNRGFGVDDLCRPLGVSRIQLYRKLKSLLDCSVNDYIVTRRLKQAKHLLLQDRSVNEVADETGFASSTYFATAFKKKYGVSPSTFKSNLKSETRNIVST